MPIALDKQGTLDAAGRPEVTDLDVFNGWTGFRCLASCRLCPRHRKSEQHRSQTAIIRHAEAEGPVAGAGPAIPSTLRHDGHTSAFVRGSEGEPISCAGAGY